MSTPDGTPAFATGDKTMRLRIVLPDRVALDMEAIKIIAQATNGSFAMLPRHLDWVAPIVPGIVLVTDPEGSETIVGTDEGTLVKCGRDVTLATRRCVVGNDLEELRLTIDASFRTPDEHEAAARSALARLETGIVRRFIELEER